MNQSDSAKIIPGLTSAGCLARQQRFVEKLKHSDVEAAIITDRRNVYYFSGHWSGIHHRPVLLISAKGKSQLVLPDVVGNASYAVDEVLRYESQKLCTLVEDQFSAAIGIIASGIKNAWRIGFDSPHIPSLLNKNAVNLMPSILELRRAKAEDEVEIIRAAIRGCEAAYAQAASMLKPGLREIDVFAEMQAAAVKEIGEPIGDLGNDFQAGSAGGPPRTRTVQSGELMPLDVSVSVRGYQCDLCRTLAVNGNPTILQQQAASKVQDCLSYVEKNVTAGGSCRELYEEVFRQLDGFQGWSFPHHLGHGTGLGAHETPRLNPQYNDHFAIGDLFTVEPGLYHNDLKAGVRIEQNYWLTENGLTRLSSFPTGLN